MFRRSVKWEKKYTKEQLENMTVEQKLVKDRLAVFFSFLFLLVVIFVFYAMVPVFMPMTTCFYETPYDWAKCFAYSWTYGKQITLPNNENWDLWFVFFSHIL